MSGDADLAENSAARAELQVASDDIRYRATVNNQYCYNTVSLKRELSAECSVTAVTWLNVRNRWRK